MINCNLAWINKFELKPADLIHRAAGYMLWSEYSKYWESTAHFCCCCCIQAWLSERKNLLCHCLLFAVYKMFRRPQHDQLVIWTPLTVDPLLFVSLHSSPTGPCMLLFVSVVVLVVCRPHMLLQMASFAFEFFKYHYRKGVSVSVCACRFAYYLLVPLLLLFWFCFSLRSLAPLCWGFQFSNFMPCLQGLLSKCPQLERTTS